MELCWAMRLPSQSLPLSQSHRSGLDFRRNRVVCLSSSNSDSTQPLKVSPMTISVTGATGFIGQRLIRKLLADERRVYVLTRSRTKALSVFPDFPRITIAEEEDWEKCIQGSNAVVNLAGMPISTRWSAEIKKEIKQSRIGVTSKVVNLINKMNADVRPSVLVSATAIGYYGTSETEVFDETSPSGNDYLSEVCREWEAKALEVNKDVRVVLIRIGVVLGKDGGALVVRYMVLELVDSQRVPGFCSGQVYGTGACGFPKRSRLLQWSAKMIPLFMMFAGGPLGTGKQWFSWIHLDDLVDLIVEALDNPSYKGTVNGTAPNPVLFSEMCDHLGQALGRPSWLPVPDFALKAVLGEGASIVLEGQRVVPVRAKELGFSFKYPFIKDALKNIVS